jgi:hypothetical protein
MTFWKTTLNLSINNTKLKSGPIQIKRGVYQGDSLSPLWFCLAINPLTNLLNKTGYGFNIRLNNTTLSKLNHLLYMDDIKLNASKKNHILSLLTITENFSNDIGMSFGIDKCKMQSIQGVSEIGALILTGNRTCQKKQLFYLPILPKNDV